MRLLKNTNRPRRPFSRDRRERTFHFREFREFRVGKKEERGGRGGRGRDETIRKFYEIASLSSPFPEKYSLLHNE